MKKNVTAIILTLLLIFSLTACGGSSDTKKEADNKQLTDITVVLDWTPNTNHTGLYTAIENGYYKEAGFNVEIVQPPDDGAEALVGSGKAQFGVSFQDSLAPTFASEDSLPITAVAAILQHNTSGIISRKGDGIDRPKGMEGKQYATWDLDIEKAIIKDVVKTDGGNPEKIKMIPSTVTDEVSALKAKSVDAIWIYEGWAGIAAKVADFDYDYFAFRDINDTFDYYTPVLVANNDFLKDHPDETKAFLAATKKGYEYAIKNPDKAADILLKAAPELDEKLVKESQKYMADQYIADADNWGYIDPARWNKFYNWLNEKKLVDGTLKENVGFTNDYLEQK
ncbi:MAG: ABC transporter substrate-binding protein [Lachnospiraceae bacterium]|nr:ABC transporter substrate-binding protein [Lachnospiraceae bacterium]